MTRSRKKSSSSAAGKGGVSATPASHGGGTSGGGSGSGGKKGGKSGGGGVRGGGRGSAAPSSFGSSVPRSPPPISTKKVKLPYEHVIVLNDQHEDLADALAHTERLLTREGFEVSVKRNRGLTGTHARKTTTKSQETKAPHVLKLRCPRRRALDREAEGLELWKKTVDGDYDPFISSAGCEFSGFHRKDDPQRPNGPDAFYAPRERAELINGCLESVRIDKSFASRFHLTKKLESLGTHGIYLLPELRRMGVLEASFALHDEKLATEILHESLKSWISLPVDKIRHYYGEYTAFYFVWMNFFTLWLIFPAILGLALFFHRPDDMTIDESPYAPIYALVVVIWGIVFLQYWRRECASKACQWNTLEHEGQARVRPDFYGVLHISPITEREELYYPRWKRMLKYTFSGFVTALCLAVAFGVMVCSLNLQGYIHSHESAFHIGFLHQYATEGAIFDPNGPFLLTLIPVVLHTTVILILNQFMYRSLATSLTDWENHRTDEEYENSLILKRFFFEAFDCYIALFYLAFYENNIILLRQELLSLYTTDAIRRVMTESILPLVVQLATGRVTSDEEDGSKKTVNFWSVSSQVRRDEGELFDDYLEMLVEFGYVTLFASAFPLCAAVSVLCNVIEVRSDSFKLAYVNRRPNSSRVKNMGTWEAVLTCMVWLSILTNTLIFGVGSDQVTLWFPSLFHTEHLSSGVDDVVVSEGSGRYLIGLLWFLEHWLLLVALAIYLCVPSLPRWVRTTIARRRHKEHVAKWELITQRIQETPGLPPLPDSPTAETEAAVPPTPKRRIEALRKRQLGSKQNC